MTAKRTGQKSKDDERTFESALERLEKIVAEMEKGTLNLDDMIARFEEGQSLVKFCSEKLNEVERKIEVLVKKGNRIISEPLDKEDNNLSDSGEEGEEEQLF
ncbi:MAG: exodeoxyribonuclease VII small subunit [Lentisphaerae bacterium]|nr:exodeoxyribonuclease VII small subunit [Lentisphaerota bacterium]